ncbi:MAG: family efflux transporter, subunit [Schlesneria sp.]|nr:family efflux transporter, subunit [Schlesneria sp.]
MKGSRVQTLILLLVSLSLFACSSPKVKPPRKAPQVTVALVQSKTVTLSEKYVCQLRADHHIEIRAQEIGYVDAIEVKERQMVKQGDVLFQINYKKLFQDKATSSEGTSPKGTNLTKARADADAAAVALGVAPITAPFDGMVGPISLQVGSIIQKGEALTTLSDNDLMRAYFHVSEARYLEFKTELERQKDEPQIELVLPNGNKFDQPGKFAAIGANFNSETGTVSFRADFANPDHLLRNGQTASLLISRVQNDAIVIPQRATFEINDDRYVYVVDKDNVAHRREIFVQDETDNLFVIKEGLHVDEKIIVNGALQVHDGEKVEYNEQPSK